MRSDQTAAPRRVVDLRYSIYDEGGRFSARSDPPPVSVHGTGGPLCGKLGRARPAGVSQRTGLYARKAQVLAGLRAIRRVAGK